MLLVSVVYSVKSRYEKAVSQLCWVCYVELLRKIGCGDVGKCGLVGDIVAKDPVPARSNGVEMVCYNLGIFFIDIDGCCPLELAFNTTYSGAALWEPCGGAGYSTHCHNCTIVCYSWKKYMKFPALQQALDTSGIEPKTGF